MADGKDGIVFSASVSQQQGLYGVDMFFPHHRSSLPGFHPQPKCIGNPLVTGTGSVTGRLSVYVCMSLKAFCVIVSFSLTFILL